MSLILEIENLSFEYDQQNILENISFKVETGEYLGILGPNGGGKTTLLKLILGILRPSKGEIRLLGKNLNDSKEKYKIGYLPQKINGNLDFPATVSEIVATGLTKKDKNSSSLIQKALNISGVANLQNRQLSQLSGGERQKVFIARSLVSQPEMLILDEPTVAIDVGSQADFYEFIKVLNQEHKISILLVSHDIGSITKEVSKVLFLNKKLECFHNTKEFLSAANLERLYGSQTYFINHHNHQHV